MQGVGCSSLASRGLQAQWETDAHRGRSMLAAETTKQRAEASDMMWKRWQARTSALDDLQSLHIFESSYLAESSYPWKLASCKVVSRGLHCSGALHNACLFRTVSLALRNQVACIPLTAHSYLIEQRSELGAGRSWAVHSAFVPKVSVPEAGWSLWEVFFLLQYRIDKVEMECQPRDSL